MSDYDELSTEYPRHQSCATCRWCGDFDRPILPNHMDLYCHEPESVDAEGNPKDYVYSWMGCNRHQPRPGGLRHDA